MLRMPTMGGAEALRLLLDDVPAARHAEILGVSQRTIRRWLAPNGKPPRAALQALFWHTRWGDSQIRSDYQFRTLIEGQLHQARAVAWVRQPAANEGVYARPALRLARSAGQRDALADG